MKSKVSLYLDEDLHAIIKQTAKAKGERYQVMINRVLREVVFNEITLNKRVDIIEDKIAKIETKVTYGK